jgi:hypothetical protein
MRFLSKLVWLCCPVLLCAQTPAAGLQPDWDVRVILQEMSDHATRLQPVLNQVDVNAWVAKGASETYRTQLQSSKDQARTFAEQAKMLARNPEKLAPCLELYFRIQALEQMIGSLVEGTRKYQDAALAETLASLSAEDGANRNRLETYIVNLASQREQECAVMDREAQRCRSVLATRPPSSSNRGKKK